MASPPIVARPKLVKELRVVLELDASEGPNDRQLGDVIAHVGGDVDLAATALTMRPRPTWVYAIVGDR